MLLVPQHLDDRVHLHHLFFLVSIRDGNSGYSVNILFHQNNTLLVDATNMKSGSKKEFMKSSSFLPFCLLDTFCHLEIYQWSGQHNKGSNFIFWACLDLSLLTLSFKNSIQGKVFQSYHPSCQKQIFTLKHVCHTPFQKTNQSRTSKHDERSDEGQTCYKKTQSKGCFNIPEKGIITDQCFWTSGCGGFRLHNKVIM